MSGFFAIARHDGSATAADALAAMCDALGRRGPEAQAVRSLGATALGHTLLATTAEMQREQLPLEHGPSGCSITGDVRLDNREALITALDLAGQDAVLGEVEIVLYAYLRWGEDCPRHLLGDFAFAIHDRRRQHLFCARDHFGIKPFYYHSSDRLFVCASEPEALTRLADIPGEFNPSRIADFLVSELEGIDLTSTFYRDISRLPPAHRITADHRGARISRYWSLEPGEALQLDSDDAYTEAFLEVFTSAVSCRMRSHRSVGVMMSGGVDSTAVAAVGARYLEARGRGPLPTFSAVSTPGGEDPESRAIRRAQQLPGLRPFTTSESRLGELGPRLVAALGASGEPFEYYMTLVRSLYLDAQDKGVVAVLDGTPGDNVLSASGYLPRLLRAGHWASAWREAKLLRRFWGNAFSPRAELAAAARSAFTPDWLKSAFHQLRGGPGARFFARGALSGTLISEQFARDSEVALRLARLRGAPGSPLRQPIQAQAAQAMRYPYITVALERYSRVASVLGIEPRHPWMDRRLVEFCISLPGSQRVAGGWPKAILRRAMAGYLPDDLRYRSGKEHLGYHYSCQFARAYTPALQAAIRAQRAGLAPYVDAAHLQQILDSAGAPGNNPPERILALAGLALWLESRAGAGAYTAN